MRYSLLFAISLIPFCSFAQTIIPDECDDKLFTRVENIASIKSSKEAFEDSLTAFLQSKKAFRDKDRIKFRFIVTTRSNIFELEKESGAWKKENVVREAIIKYSSLWKPAVQNGRNVCSYVMLELNIEGDKLHISISQDS